MVALIRAHPTFGESINIERDDDRRTPRYDRRPIHNS